MTDGRRTSCPGWESPRTPPLDRRAFGEPVRAPGIPAHAFQTPAFRGSGRDPFAPERGGGAGDLRPRPRSAPERVR